MGFAGSESMKITARALLVSLLLAGTGAVVTGCNTDKDIDITKLGVETDPPEILYNQGLANIKAGNMTEAGRKFDAINQQQPFSEWARKALVMSTFVKYRTGRYDDAVQSGNSYLKQYPGSEDADYVQYLVGSSYAKQIVDVTQDQRAAQQTIEAMSKLVSNYPNSQYVERRAGQDSLCPRPARRQGNADRPLLSRAQGLSCGHCSLPHRRRAISERRIRSKRRWRAWSKPTIAMGIVPEAQTAAAVLGHNYPDSRWYADSFKLLKTGGVEPRESEGSWISRAGKKLLLGT